jgi:hypothetical protein
MTVEQDGPVVCEVAGGGGFVRLHLPVRVIEETGGATPLPMYQVDDFVGRDGSWSWLSESRANVIFRIPAMLLQEHAGLMLARGTAYKVRPAPRYGDRGCGRGRREATRI